MNWNIVFWHGESSGLVEELLEVPGTGQHIVSVDGEDVSRFFYTGTLDDFCTHYPRSFIANKEREYIAITQFNSFGQR
jgi:hypothetical protein